MTQLMTILEDYLNWRGYSYLRYRFILPFRLRSARFLDFIEIYNLHVPFFALFNFGSVDMCFFYKEITAERGLACRNYLAIECTVFFFF
jgi:hypothetical protein